MRSEDHVRAVLVTIASDLAEFAERSDKLDDDERRQAALLDTAATVLLWVLGEINTPFGQDHRRN